LPVFELIYIRQLIFLLNSISQYQIGKYEHAISHLKSQAEGGIRGMAG